LIRDETDRGVLMICDPRLISKPYGKRIWQSLPSFARTRAEADVVSFLRNCMLPEHHRHAGIKRST
jgi:ATP-dependent DNA helicase DinG